MGTQSQGHETNTVIKIENWISAARKATLSRFGLDRRRGVRSNG
jgi:hypothetical protein